MEESETRNWKPELDAIVGARHGGQVSGVLNRLQALDARYPNVAEINYQLAWTCDVLGRSEEALPFYEKAVALGLPGNELSGALLGLGSTLRALGRLERSREVLEAGRIQFPDNREFEAFLALTLHESGESTEALRLLLHLLVDTSEDVGITAYQRALRFHAAHLHAPGDAAPR
jgi:tetratricopeptide (TPR) repeat protein